ncbi:Imm63 family immunity protein [Enterococcus faecalis]|uniref:Imm63 family immunity protein n=1 Tax=Enterococcus TaxID=1350 RepID=UPI00053571ED|nr:Imm63 family immunity protein [Enterococcus faecalis]EHS2295424.1 hypothetical protein [Enterococcus faecalis]
MDNILETSDLEKYIKDIIQEKLKKYSQCDVKFSVNFERGNKGDMDGEYVYSSSTGYYYLYLERGQIENKKRTENLFDIVYWSLKEYIFELTMDYAKKNRNNAEDFRRILFGKELEIWASIGQNLYMKRKQEIEEILIDNPYSD